MNENQACSDYIHTCEAHKKENCAICFSNNSTCCPTCTCGPSCKCAKNCKCKNCPCSKTK